MIAINNLRIAADVNRQEPLEQTVDGRPLALWRGSDFFLKLTVFRDGVLEDVSNLQLAVAEIKPLEEDDSAPGNETLAVSHQTIMAGEINKNLTEDEWKLGEGDQFTFHFASTTALVAGGYWIVVWGMVGNEGRSVIPLAAGRLAILESAISMNGSSWPDSGSYSREEADERFVKQKNNLLDLVDISAARNNLGLGSAALSDLLNEENFDSDSPLNVPSQHSVKAYVGGRCQPILDHCTSLEADLDTLVLETEKMGTRLTSLDEALTTVDSSVSTLETEITTLQNQTIEALQASDFSQDQSIEALEAATSAHDDRLGSVETKVDQNVLDIAILQSQIAAGGGDGATIYQDFFPANRSFSCCGRSGNLTCVNLLGSTTGTYQAGPERWAFVTISAKNPGVTITRKQINPDNMIDYKVDFAGFNDLASTGVYIAYPFTFAETAPLLGKTVTLSFDAYQAAAAKNVTTIVYEIICPSATAKPINEISLHKTNGYINGCRVIHSQTADLTPDFCRQTMTFTVPSDIFQLALRISILPSKTYTSDVVGLGIARFRLDLGSEAHDYVTPDLLEEQLKSWRLMQFVRLYMDNVDRGSATSIRYYYRFPQPLYGNPSLLACYDITNPVGVDPATNHDSIERTERDVVFDRPVLSNFSGRCSINSDYFFGVKKLW